MVSYNRSRAEALGVDCAVGLMQRPERIVFIGVWSIIWGIVYWVGAPSDLELGSMILDYYTLGFVFLAITTNITALRRLFYSEDQLRKITS